MTPAIVLLTQRNIAHRVLTYDHDPATDSYGMEAADALGLDPATVHKTLVARTDDGRHIVGVVPVDGQLDLKALARAVGAKKATMADVADAERLTGYVAGGISPLGQKSRLPLVVDEMALASDEIFVSGGKRGVDIGLAPQDLIDVVDAITAPIAG